MSSGHLFTDNNNYFKWNDKCNIENYLIVCYYIESQFDSYNVAVSICREQSVTNIGNIEIKEIRHIEKYTARVIDVENIDNSLIKLMPDYQYESSTPKKGKKNKNIYTSSLIRLAFPVSIFGKDFTSIWNIVGGEIHRLGFLNTIKILDFIFPKSMLKKLHGPTFGVSGLRKILKVYDRPLLCRSTRPAVGLRTKDMLLINRKVLTGGFDLIKDDELTFDNALSPFKTRIKLMMQMKEEVEFRTGEKKMYICNITASPIKSLEYADMAAEIGVDAFLICPGLQGIEFGKDLSEKYKIPILYHNSWIDVITRLPTYGVSDHLLLKLFRICGADMVVMPGNFATDQTKIENDLDCINACLSPKLGIKQTLPLLAGGKIPSMINTYRNHVGSQDFGLIIATFVDNYQSGIENGAKLFKSSL